MEETRRLAEFCARVHLEDVPPAVVLKARLCILDWVANIYGSLELGAVQAVVAYGRSLGGRVGRHRVARAQRQRARRHRRDARARARRRQRA